MYLFCRFVFKKLPNDSTNSTTNKENSTKPFCNSNIIKTSASLPNTLIKSNSFQNSTSGSAQSFKQTKKNEQSTINNYFTASPNTKPINTTKSPDFLQIQTKPFTKETSIDKQPIKNLKTDWLTSNQDIKPNPNINSINKPTLPDKVLLPNKIQEIPKNKNYQTHCQICDVEFVLNNNQSKFRRVTESCGHTFCFQCIIKGLNCKLCSVSSFKSDFHFY